MLDSDGKVVGVARATLFGANINLAIPVGQLDRFLKKPDLILESPPLTWENQSQEVTWTIRPRARCRRTRSRGCGRQCPGEIRRVRTEVYPETRSRWDVQTRGRDRADRPRPVGRDQADVRLTIELLSGERLLLRSFRNKEITAPTNNGQTIVRRIGPDGRTVTITRNFNNGSNGLEDKAFFKVGRDLDVDGVPIGSAREIRRRPAEIARASVTYGEKSADNPPTASKPPAPAEIKLEGQILQVVRGGGGRYLFVTSGLPGAWRSSTPTPGRWSSRSRWRRTTTWSPPGPGPW